VRHAIAIVLAAAIALSLAAAIRFYGAHDMLGFSALVIGYPGFAVITATDLENKEAEVLFTAVNWVFYFGLFEVIWFLWARFRRAPD